MTRATDEGRTGVSTGVFGDRPASRADVRRAHSGDEEAEAVTVLYIAGSSRTGSTIVANILGQVDGFFAVGELWNIWRRGLLERRKCGCGSPLDDCPVWSDILRCAFGRPPRRADAERLDALARKRLRAREAPRVLRSRGSVPVGNDEYLAALAQLYRAVPEVTGCRVIVDSSKSPVYAALLATIPGVCVHAVHLVRDARAAAFSNSRVRALPDFGDQRFMQREHPLTTARRWAKWHAVTEGLLPGRVSSFVNVRYEDFVSRPAVALERILSMIDEPVDLPLVDDHTVRLGPTHSVSGNPSRFQTGDVELRLDDEWVTAMPGRDRAMVTALTWPLLLRHRYPFGRRLVGHPAAP